MKTNGLYKLDLSDLAHVTGGQIYKVNGKEIYVVPSAAGYVIYRNKTEALDNFPPLAKKGIISCQTVEVAKILAKRDSDSSIFASKVMQGVVTNGQN